MIFEFTRKKLLISLGLLVVIIAIPLTVYLAQIQQDQRGRAAKVTPENAIVATINGEDIRKSDVRKVAEEQYARSAVDKTALKDGLDILIERKLLDAEAKVQQITPNTLETMYLVEGEGFSDKEAYYEVLKKEINLKTSKTRQANSIGFWLPNEAYRANLESVDKETAATQIAVAVPALSEIETRLKNGEGIVAVANSVSSKYPVLSKSISINGEIIDGLTDAEKQAIANGKIYGFADSNLDVSVRNGLFAMQKGEIKKFTPTENNAGGYVFTLLEIGNDSGSASYDTWLSDKRNSVVIMKDPL